MYSMHGHDENGNGMNLQQQKMILVNENQLETDLIVMLFPLTVTSPSTNMM